MEFWFFKIAGITAALMLLPSYKIHNDHRPRLIVWNVGQGQWITWSQSQSCTHIDMGGEKFPSAKILNECRGKSNRVLLTHSDWDHISFLPWAIKRWPTLCLEEMPREKLNEKKSDLLAKLKLCRTKLNRIADLFPNPPKHFTKPNDISRVYFLRDSKILIPGDSSSKAELLWAQNALNSKILILGHHGSRTSTSEHLLKKLTQLTMTAASARSRKYGHPHPLVVQRLKNRTLPLLTTESWGSLSFELD